MELNFNDIPVRITKQEILDNVPLIDLWQYYIPEFKHIGTSFLSPLRDENSPSAYIYISDNNELKYKDFGNGNQFDIFGFIQAKYNVNFYESLNIIANDFGLTKCSLNPSLKPLIAISGGFSQQLVKIKSEISVIEQGWNIVDYNYWSQFGINFEFLDKYNVKSIKSVTLDKNNKRFVFNSSKSNPKYIYYFDSGLKVYSPYANKQEKWLCNGSFIEGYSQLDNKSDILIITSSLKDVMVYRLLGINAISSSSENNVLNSNFIDELHKRFTNIIVNMDGDLTGITINKLYKEKYDLNWFIIDKEKDVSDYIKKFGLEKTRKMIKNKIDGCRRIS